VPWVHHAFKAYHIVSWSYRLAPIAAMADMAEDGLDAYAWCRAHLPAMLDIDLEACAVGGDSAGGCLATLLGGLVSPAPRAVLADQAITDLADAWFDGHPDPPAAYSGEFTHAEIAAAAHDRDLAHAIIGAACYDGEDVPSEESLRNEFGSNSLKFGRPERLQLDVRRYLASRSRWVRSVAHPEKYDEEGVRTQLRKWPPVHRLENTPSYPPTFFVHGEEDECVPARQSRDMAARLRQMGVHVGEHYEPSAGHCFNQRFGVS
jgi:acetyl esterase/lipase